MNVTVLTLTPSGRPLAQSLGFAARTVTVDNYTSSYVVLPDAGKTIPPWTYGAVVALPPGLRVASASLVATVPAVAGPPVPTSQATLTWSDQALAADPGHVLQQSAYSQQPVIGTLQAAVNQSAPQTTINVPAGTMSIGYLVWSGGGLDTPNHVSILGHQSGNAYVSTAPLSNIGGPQWFPFASSDTSVDVNLTAPAASGARIDVLASPLVEVLDIQQTFGNVLNAHLTDNAGNSIDLDNSAVGQFELGVSMVRANPAPWQAPNLAPIEINVGLGAGPATSTLLAAVAGKKVYLFSCALSYDAVGGQVRLQDTAGTEYHSFGGIATVTPPPFMGFGTPFPVGVGVRLANLAGAPAATVRGSLVVSQA